jgi:hypothetical protein
MTCILKNRTPDEHATALKTRPKILGTELPCPLYNGRTICLWCCLHIAGIAEPLNRGDNEIRHPEYNIVMETGRSWDEITSLCTKCINTRS